MADTYRFIICGAGGVGSWLAEGLVRMLEYKAKGSMLVIVDGDNYEEKNKERQNFNGAGNKADVLAAQIQPQFLETMVVPLPRWIVAKTEEQDPSDVEEDGSAPAGLVAAKDLLSDGAVVYAVVDNFKARRIIIDAAAEIDNIDVFLGGNDDALFCSVYHYRRRDGKDITDNPILRNEELANPPDRNPGEMSCAERAKLEGGTQFIAANFGVAALLLGKTQEVILNDGNMAANDTFLDLGLGLAQSFDRSTEAETVSV